MHILCKKLAFSFLFTVLLVSSSKTVLAQSASDSAEASSSAQTQINQELKKRMEKALSEAGTVAGALTTLLSERTSFVGEVTRVSQEAITVKQFSGNTIIPLTDTVELLKAGKKVSADDIEVGGWVSVLGTRDGNQVDPEFVLVSATSLKPKDKLVVLASLSEITRTEIKFVPRSSQDGTEQTVKIDKNSTFESSDGSEAVRTDFEKDYSVLIVAQKNADEETYTLTTLHALSDLKK